MREAMTEQLRLALESAEAQARQLNQDFVGTEHLLLGILGTDHALDHQSEAVHALRGSEVNIDELRGSLVDALPHCAEPPVVTGNLPLSPNAKQAVNAALTGAQAAREPRVSTRLLLRALLEDPESEIRAALRTCGADVERLQSVLDERARQPED